MTKDEYKKRLAEQRIANKKAIYEIDLAYAKAQVKFNRGDIITNGTQILRVDKFRLGRCYSTEFPIPTYVGELLTKQLKPFKKRKLDATLSNGFCNTISLIKVNDTPQ